MRTVSRWATILLATGVASLPAGCAGAPEQAAASAINPQVLEALKPLDTPYQIIYHPPVDLAKRPAS